MSSKHLIPACLLWFAITTPTLASVVVPNGLQAGDMYHLAFVTEGTTSAFGMSNITFYNQFVQTEAALNPSLTGTGMGVTWSAIASTPATRARDNALVEAPVYLLDGTTLIANGFNDMWDGSIQNPINLTQSLNAVADGTRTWTGSFSSGFGHPTFELGISGTGTTGNANSSSSDWIFGTIAFQNNEYSLYALSEKLTVPEDAQIPEPASVVVWLCLASVMGLRRPSLRRGTRCKQ